MKEKYIYLIIKKGYINYIMIKRSYNLRRNFTWHQISQKANDFLRISALASKMGQIEKINALYYTN